MDLLEIQRAIKSGLKPLEAVAPLRLSEWAERHFYLSAESSQLEQQWVAYPFQRAIMDAISNDEIEEVSFKKSARLGYSKMLTAAIAYFAQHKRRNQALWQPTDEDSDEFVKTDLEPMFRDVPVLSEVFPEFLQKNKHNTLRQKIFLGSILHLRGGKAAKNYRRLTVAVAYLDELDGFDSNIEKEGDPVSLARKRLEGATFPKLVAGSTPKLKGFSLIEKRTDQADALYRWHVPCPHCDAMQSLRWGGKDKPYGFKWTARDPETVAHLCEACGALFTQAQYLAAWARGRWMALDGTWIDDTDGSFRNPAGECVKPPRAIGFAAWTALSPQVSWAAIVREFLAAVDKKAAGDDTELQSFTNLTLGEPWEARVEKADEQALKQRANAAPYPLRRVQLGGLVLVAGVDVQDDRFVATVWALGRGEEMWAVDYTVLDANPADERDWDKLDTYLQTKFQHESGAKLEISATGVDTGGHFTHQVYNFCRQRTARRIFAVKGETRESMPVKSRAAMQDVNQKGRVIKRGVKLWHVGTDTAKDLFFGRLQVEKPGPGYVHFSHELPDEFYSELTAEARVVVKTARGEVYRWSKLRLRNEALDCTVYAIFASHMLDVHKFTEAMWGRYELAVQPPTRDMFAPGETSESGAKEAPESSATAPGETQSLRPVPALVPRDDFGSREWSSRL